MGRPQLAYRKLAEANIEITNKMSAPLARPSHTRTHADTLEQTGEGKKTQLSMSRKSSSWREVKRFGFLAPAVHVLNTPHKDI